jgi:hypothetical protein
MAKGETGNSDSGAPGTRSHGRQDQVGAGSISKDGMLEVSWSGRSRLRTSGHKFKCGVTDQDLYKIFMTGLDGTPMPSFADNINPDQAWDLVFYLRTFQPMKSKEKQIAKQLGLKPIDPSVPLPQPPTENK